MSLKIRLARAGAKKRPYYRIVVADLQSPRDGRYIEKLGTYDPLQPRARPSASSSPRSGCSIGSASARSPPTACSASSTRPASRSATRARTRRKGQPGKKRLEREEAKKTAAEEKAKAAAEAAAAPAARARARARRRGRSPCRRGRATRRVALAGKADRVLLGEIGARARPQRRGPAALLHRGAWRDRRLWSA